MKRFKAVYCGTPDFSLPVLELLFNHPSIELHSVVTMPDRPSGRGQDLKSPPVAVFARDNKIKLIQTENINREEAYLDELKSVQIDLIIVLAFAQFLSSKVLSIPRLGCFNIHTSLLPRYRGAAPIQYALLNGDQETGVSIQRMVKKMDAGDIAWSDKLTIAPNETGAQLYTRLKFQAALSLNNLLQSLLLNNVSYTQQDESLVTFAPTLKKEDGLLDFKNKTFQQLFNQVRALTPWPGTYCFLGKKRLRVLTISPYNKKLSPGESSTELGMLLIGCQDGCVRAELVQLEGKNVTSDTQLLNGIREKVIINPS